jgi:ubiquinone biosynthesis monooxygenase Coq7
MFVTSACQCTVRTFIPRQLSRLASTYNASEEQSKQSKRKLTLQQREKIASMIRVDHAGEQGADAIYQGQINTLGRRTRDPNLRLLLQHMWEQEKVHLSLFENVGPIWRTRPSFLSPVWQVAGYTVGAISGLLGKEAAMACTEAVETVIGGHYNECVLLLHLGSRCCLLSELE